MSGLKVASINVRGLNRKLKRKSIFNKCKQYDVICLQETYITKERFEEWKKDWPGSMVYTSSGSVHSRGQIILLNKSFQESDFETIVEKERILGIKLSFGNLQWKIFNVYGPNKDYGPEDKTKRKDFISELYTIFNNSEKENTVVCGDFNVVLNNDLDICTGGFHDREIVQLFNNWVNSSLLVDTWRIFNPDNKDFTYSTPKASRRLDYIFVSENILPTLTGSEHIFVGGTDHKIVSSTFNTDTFERGKSYWKFNASLLKDIEYVDIMNNHIVSFLQSEVTNSDPIERLELLKLSVKSKSIEYSTLKNKLRKDKERQIQRDLIVLNKNFISNPNDRTVFGELESKKKELELIQIHKTKGAITRARAQEIRDGEKNSKFFLNLERYRGNSNTILQVENDTDKSVSNGHFGVLKSVKNHFEGMSKKDHNIKGDLTKINEYLSGADHPKLGDAAKNVCEAPLTVVEIGNALLKLNNDSAPGIDGIPVSFYKVFWNVLKQPVFDSIMHSIDRGEMSTTQKRGIITLFHKGKDLRRDLLKNWRPITLTNTDYKIFSKVLAMRMQQVLSLIINVNQSGFLKGRSISDHIRTLDDIICVTNKDNKVGMIVSLDFAKAFDSVDHSIIIGSLQKFNFGDNFIKMITTLMNNNESCVQNGGWLSGFFKVERGIKQGCCVSPLLFLLVAEIMAIKIRNNNNISGFSTNNILIKILQYCDDTTLILKDEGELEAAINDIDTFSIISGLRLNKSKSMGMWIGRSKNNASTPGDINWIKLGEYIKILGIYFNASDEISNIERNWIERVEKIKVLMKRWQSREPSVYGKILVCKTYLLSQISYIIQSLSLPEKVLKEIDALFFRFIWQTRRSNTVVIEKIKRNVMCKDIKDGGLGMIRATDQQRVFLLKWLQKSLDKNSVSNLSNANIPNQYFRETGGIRYMTSASVPYTNIGMRAVPRFWQDVFRTWCDFRESDSEHGAVPNSINKILQEPLFYNTNIKYKGTHLFFKQWVKAGVTHVCHLFDRGVILNINQLLNRVRNYGAMYLDYNAIYNAIPVRWKIMLREGRYDNIDIDAIRLSVMDSEAAFKKLNYSNKVLRKRIADYSGVTICGRGFWRRIFGVDILDNFKIAFNSTKESRLRLLHFKILHNIYPTNILLHRMGIKGSDQCDFCPQREVVEHMFIYCPRLEGFWSMIFNIIYARTSIRVQRTDQRILFGIKRSEVLCTQEQLNIINHIILIAKMCISKTKAGNATLLGIVFEMELAAREDYLR